MQAQKWLKRTAIAATTALALAGMTGAAASTDMFLKIDGVTGESATKGHEKEIEILSFSWGVFPKTDKPNAHTCVGDITFTKNVDMATPQILTLAVVGTAVPKAVLTLRKAGVDPVDFMTLEMTQVMVVSVAEGGSVGQSNLVEQFALRFAGMKLSFRQQNPDGTPGAPIVSTLSGGCF
jgi:type VI secretion system secreted protein Hcp